MAQNIYTSEYKGQKSIVLIGGKLRTEFVTKGARMVSLFDTGCDYEFLLQQKGERYIYGSYDRCLPDYEPCGFDEMFPNIDECFYEEFPWKGHRMPDHGEVWSLEWDYEIMSESVKMSVFGIRLPYKLEKTIRFIDDRKLEIFYKLYNNSEFDINYIWAAHPMLKWDEAVEITLPENCKRAVCMFSKSGNLGGYGEELYWNGASALGAGGLGTGRYGNSFNAGDSEKYYFKDRLEEGWIKIRYPQKGIQLSFMFDLDRVPYLGIVASKADVGKEGFIIPEPCTAPYDRMDIARLHLQDSRIEGKKSHEWRIRIASN